MDHQTYSPANFKICNYVFTCKELFDSERVDKKNSSLAVEVCIQGPVQEDLHT